MTTLTRSGIADLARRRVDGTYSVDEWGLDPDLVSIVSPLAGLRWRIEVDGRGHLPDKGPVVIVHNRRFGWSEPFVIAQAVRKSVGQHARPVGMPDFAPVGTVMRRLGGVLNRPDEVAGLLRSGALVALPLARDLSPRPRAGSIHAIALAAACDLGVPVVPAALYGHEAGRRWRVAFGPKLDPAPDGGLPAAADMAEEVRARVQTLLDSTVPGRWARLAWSPFG